jgi:hypothetical protein
MLKQIEAEATLENCRALIDEINALVQRTWFNLSHRRSLAGSPGCSGDVKKKPAWADGGRRA